MLDGRVFRLEVGGMFRGHTLGETGSSPSVLVIPREDIPGHPVYEPHFTPPYSCVTNLHSVVYRLGLLIPYSF